MASDVEIANRALQKLGAKRITVLNEDSVNGRACNACYSVLRDAELEKHPWNFAIGRAELAADATAPDWGRGNAFTLPADFIRLLEDYPEQANNQKDWQIEGNKILTNDSGPLQIRYIKRVTDPNLMSPLFRETVSARMAMEMCEEITQSNSKKADAKDDYDKAIKEAKRSNAIQNVAQDAPTDSWLTARR